MNAQLYTFIKEEFMRRLDHDACAITGIVFATTGTAMFHVFQYRQCIGNNLVGFIAFDIGNKTNTTGIMFKFRSI